MINASVSLLSHDYTHLYLRDIMGRRGLIVVGVGKSGERGFQMLYRFSDICDRLEACGVNVIFVYPRESASVRPGRRTGAGRDPSVRWAQAGR